MAVEQLAKLMPAVIDTHVHVGDNFHNDGGLSRLWTPAELDKIGILTVGKAHFLPFVPEMKRLYGSTTLNAVLDPEHIRQVAREMSRPFVVWFPSLNAKAHHDVVAGDIAWQSLFTGVSLGQPISVFTKSGVLSTEAKETVKAIAETKAIMATGHLSAAEVKILVPHAIMTGVKRIVLTHVSARHSRLTPEAQQHLIQMGMDHGVSVFAEHCAITWFDGKEGAYDFQRDFVTPIQFVGASHCIISSDCGRVVKPGSDKPITPQECLLKFGQMLLQQDVTFDDLRNMMVDNPHKLLEVN